MRAGAVAAEHRSAGGNCRTRNCAIASPPRGRDGRLLIGHFGSIYPGKQPNALLEIGAILKAAGRKPLVVYIGSFIRGVDNVEEDFHARAAELGVADDVIVSGYVASDHEVFGLFSEIDAFCYPLDEGLTARRSSILTCVQSGRPLVVTGPALARRIRSSSALQGTDRSRRHRAGAAGIGHRGLRRPHRVRAEMAVGAERVRFRWLVAGRREGTTRAALTASRPDAKSRQIMQPEHREQEREPRVGSARSRKKLSIEER